MRKWKDISKDEKIEISVKFILALLAILLIDDTRIFIGIFLMMWANNIGRKL